jgi:hypothetical protein
MYKKIIEKTKKMKKKRGARWTGGAVVWSDRATNWFFVFGDLLAYVTTEDSCCYVTVTSLLNKSTWSTAVERARLISSPPPF